jgi:diacylglycerol kinase (ATP)
MRVILMHNPTAGSGDHTCEHLVTAIERAGHEVVCDVSSNEALLQALLGPCDLVAVAGGDGTIGATAEVMIGSPVPLAALPLGTANNIARTLGFIGEPEDLIATWRDSASRPFDVARFHANGEPGRFYECFGFGIFSETIRESRRLPERVAREDTLAQHLSLVRALVATGATQQYSLVIDGVDRSGEYLLLEVMNVPYLGPRLGVAPDADPHDGWLDVVLVAPRDRRMLLDHIDALERGVESKPELVVVRARHVIVTANDRDYHRDGHLEPLVDGVEHRFEITVEPGALQVLRRRSHV